MHTDIAANSDSTLRYSHPVRVPACTSRASPSTMCVWGEIGYAATTSGRQRATVSATATEPSSCRSTGRLQGVGGARGGDVALRVRAGEPLADRALQRRERKDSGHRDERGEQRRAGQRAAEVLTR